MRIAIIGDSTVASCSNPPADRPDLTGWGQVFGELFNQMGDEGSADFSPSATDRTHSSRKGALAMAGIVADGIERTDSMLGEHRRGGSD